MTTTNDTTGLPHMDVFEYNFVRNYKNRMPVTPGQRGLRQACRDSLLLRSEEVQQAIRAGIDATARSQSDVRTTLARLLVQQGDDDGD